MWAHFSEVDGKQVAGLVPAYSRHSFASAVKTLRDRCSSHGRREGLNCVFFLVGELFLKVSSDIWRLTDWPANSAAKYIFSC